MSNLRQAAEMAVEVLENHTAIKHPQQIHYRDSAIDALRIALAEEALQRLTDVSQEIEAALAEPEQEPVAWMWRDGTVTSDPDRADGTWTPLYTTPPQREPLTDEEIEQAYRHIYRSVPDDFDHTIIGWIEQGIRYAEQAHGIGEKT